MTELNKFKTYQVADITGGGSLSDDSSLILSLHAPLGSVVDQVTINNNIMPKLVLSGSDVGNIEVIITNNTFTHTAPNSSDYSGCPRALIDGNVGPT